MGKNQDLEMARSSDIGRLEYLSAADFVLAKGHYIFYKILMMVLMY